MRYIIILLLLLASCYPPQIIYKMDDNYIVADSLKISLLNGYATSTGTRWYMNIKINLENKKSDNVYVGNFSAESYSHNNITGTQYYSEAENVDTINRFFSKKLTYIFAPRNRSEDELLLEYAFMKKKEINHKLKISFDILNSNKDSTLKFILIPKESRRIWKLK